MANDDKELLDRPVMIFGRDVRKIPCFRDSLLYGIGAGLAGGLIVFMFTSKPRLGSHSAVGIFGCVTIGYWVMCRRRWAYQKYGVGQIYGASKAARIRDTPFPPENDRQKIQVTNV